jgi:hypothetical protein
MNRSSVRFASRVIALAWACWWTWFVVASTLGECEPVGAAVARGALAVVVLFGSIAVSARWERAGAALLIAEGLAVAAVYPVGAARVFTVGSILAVVAMLGGPPLVSGLLLFAARRAGGPRRPHPAR